jgi:GNAT superfamily N-acetyltransferase
VTTPETSTADELRVRPLRQDDARGVALLVADYFAELGVSGGMSVEQTEQLFATPWLKDGTGFLLTHGTEITGYGFVRPSQWKGTDTIQFGLTLKRGFRDREIYRVLTDPLMAAALEIASKHRINSISIHLRTADTVHPPVMRELGFREHPVSMLGFSHDLREIPHRPLPQGFSFRRAKLPEESSTLIGLMAAAFDDRDRQGEPIADTYLALIAARSGFDPEQVLVVENSNGLVGGGVVDAPAAGPGGNFIILQVGVLRDHRRRGIGAALISRQLDWLKARGAGAALAGMFSSNIAATLFWRLGFRPDPHQTYHFFIRDTLAPSTQQPRRH